MRRLIIAFIAVLLAVGMLCASWSAATHLSAVVRTMPPSLLSALTVLGNLVAVFAIVAAVMRHKRQLDDDA